jgi:hypothetical protein
MGKLRQKKKKGYGNEVEVAKLYSNWSEGNVERLFKKDKRKPYY